MSSGASCIFWTGITGHANNNCRLLEVSVVPLQLINISASVQACKYKIFILLLRWYQASVNIKYKYVYIYSLGEGEDQKLQLHMARIDNLFLQVLNKSLPFQPAISTFVCTRLRLQPRLIPSICCLFSLAKCLNLQADMRAHMTKQVTAGTSGLK